MPPLTLQEVIERINKHTSPAKEQKAYEDRSKDQPYRPEFYVPRITRRLANLIFNS
jgi:hypothetical protein